MDKLLVLINGLPASGKSTSGRSLAKAFGAQFLSKDSVKEALASCGDSTVPALGGIAMDAVWALAQATSTSVVIDSWWFKPRDIQFARAGIEKVGASGSDEPLAIRSAVVLACGVRHCRAPPPGARAGRRWAARRSGVGGVARWAVWRDSIIRLSTRPFVT
ncbi:AAA family ATPase [Nocardia altamirensis]|uniref:AAA family ATPase n=1 Tax=Nocardia altamirensis TaxID=472158 RepID=UPI000ACC12CF